MNEPNLNPAKLNPVTEQLIHQVVSALLERAKKGECRCHWLDPTKTPILAWKSAKNPDTLVLKISQQKFIGLTRSDKNNEMYWKFRDFYEEVPPPVSKTPVAKEEPKLDLPPKETPAVQVASESEAVKKFQAKYGTASEPIASQ